MTTKGKRDTKAILLAACAALAIVPAIGHAESTQKVSYNISAQDLGTALTELARQSNREIYFSADLTRGKRAPRLNGNLSIEAALRRLLDGSGLSYSIKASGSIVIEVRRQAPQRQSSSTQSAAPSSGEDLAGSAAASDESADIVVTGTHIRGQAPVGSKVLAYDREDIRKSGYGTLEDFLKTVPQNFAGGVESLGGTGNFTRGLGANLRGLGSQATLSLVNGRRRPVGGDGDFVDLSTIPAAAIERVDILTDGASAIYGSDAIAGVVNVILRKDFEGVEASARYGFADGYDEKRASIVAGHGWSSGNILVGYQHMEKSNLTFDDRAYSVSADKRPFGGTDLRTYLSNPGNILNPATFQPGYAIPRNQNGVGLTVAQLLPGQSNLMNPTGGDLIPALKTDSVFFNARQSLGSISLFADGSWTKRKIRYVAGGAVNILTVPKTNPFYVNPYAGNSVLLAYNFGKDLGPLVNDGTTTSLSGAVGFDADLAPRWSLRVYGNYGREIYDYTGLNNLNGTALTAALADSNPATAFNPFADGSNTNPATLDKIRSTLINHGRSSVAGANGLLTGTVHDLPGGEVRLALGAEYRDEKLSSTRTTVPLSRSVTSAFGELVFPFITERNAMPGMQALELSLAGRYEHYSDFGNTFNPKIGARYSIVKGLVFRGSWGTSFRAPRLYDLSPVSTGGTPRVSIATMPDPLSPTGTSLVLRRTGNNPGLREERAESWTLGADLSADWITKGTTLSFSYYNIGYTGRIATPGTPSQTTILQQESTYRPIIDRNPSAALLAELCAALTTGNCTTSPAKIVVDQRLTNLAVFKTEGLDIGWHQPIDLGGSTLTGDLNLNYILHYGQQITATAPYSEQRNRVGTPARFRSRGGVSWSWDGLTANAAVNYANGMTDVNFVPNRTVHSWTTVDLGIAYQFENSNFMKGLTLSAQVLNAFDRDPPFVNNLFGYDPTNATPLGRMISFDIRTSF